MTVPARLSLVSLGVTDLARTTAFYEALGWERSSASVEGDVAFFATADGVLALYGYDQLSADAGLEPAGAVPVGGSSLGINVESDELVDQVLAEVAAAGGTVTRPAARTSWGGYVGYFTDPEGHLWEVTHNPGFTFDDRGSVVLPG